jgi:hypothetical protein
MYDKRNNAIKEKSRKTGKCIDKVVLGGVVVSTTYIRSNKAR